MASDCARQRESRALESRDHDLLHARYTDGETKARIDSLEVLDSTLGRRPVRSCIRIADDGRCSVGAVEAMEHIARAFEWIGISVIVAGSLVTVWISFAAYRTSGSAAAYEAGRRSFGRALLASLEVFVAADLIRTVSVDLTLEGVGALGLLVVIRTILSFSIDIEISGALPWRSGATETAASEGRTGGR